MIFEIGVGIWLLPNAWYFVRINEQMLRSYLTYILQGILLNILLEIIIKLIEEYESVFSEVIHSQIQFAIVEFS